MRRIALGLCILAGCAASGPADAASAGRPLDDFCRPAAAGRVLHAAPWNYHTMLAGLRPGDTLALAPGAYPRLVLKDLAGRPGACITVAGPATGPPAIIVGQPGDNTVEIIASRYLEIRDLVIDSAGIPGADGIKAPPSSANAIHHIILDGNRIVGAGATQQTDGISTKTATWGWIIRRNTVIGAGTGIYLGNSDGSDPFIAGLVENNLVIDPVGYCMEIKYQTGRSGIGAPQGPQSTIIRDNVFIKGDGPSPDGDRPNLLVGGFPDTGPGAQDLYQIYGNLIVHNPREALFQGSGRISFHDNILVDSGLIGALFRDHDLKLRLAHVYNNTVYAAPIGIAFGSPAREGSIVRGNAVFAKEPLLGTLGEADGNVVAPTASAARYVRAPSTRLGEMDFFPLPGRLDGPPLDLSPFAAEAGYDRDFDHRSKGDRRSRGAYAGAGASPAWRLRAALKN